jgi:hypothetical protein
MDDTEDINNFEYTDLLVNTFTNQSSDSNGLTPAETVLNEADLDLSSLLNSWGFGHLFQVLKCKCYVYSNCISD